MLPASVSFIFAAGLFTGIIGTMTGIGGGTVMVPLLTVVFGLPPHIAIGTSIISVITGSIIGSQNYLKKRLTNVRLGLTLETVTAAGAIAGSLVSVSLSGNLLEGVFALVMGLTIIAMLRSPARVEGETAQSGHKRFQATYYDDNEKQEITYRASNLRLGMMVSAVAGILAGLLGIGGGPLKVPIMRLAMNIPIKAAAATSNYMVGLTAAAGAYVFYTHGYIHPELVAPVIVGVIAGSALGSRITPYVNARWIRYGFTGLLVVLALQMGMNAVGY